MNAKNLINEASCQKSCQQFVLDWTSMVTMVFILMLYVQYFSIDLGHTDRQTGIRKVLFYNIETEESLKYYNTYMYY